MIEDLDSDVDKSGKSGDEYMIVINNVKVIIKCTVICCCSITKHLFDDVKYAKEWCKCRNRYKLLNVLRQVDVYANNIIRYNGTETTTG